MGKTDRLLNYWLRLLIHVNDCRALVEGDSSYVHSVEMVACHGPLLVRHIPRAKVVFNDQEVAVFQLSILEHFDCSSFLALVIHEVRNEGEYY